MPSARDRQEELRGLEALKPMEFQVGYKVMLKFSPWKGQVIRGSRVMSEECLGALSGPTCVLDSNGFKFTNENGILRVLKGSLLVMKATKGSSSLYIFQGETITCSAYVSCSEESNSDLMMLWHMRLGHMSEKCIVILSKRGLLDNQKVVNLEFCEHCVIRKQKRFNEFCIDKGIERHYTVRYTPQQNEVEDVPKQVEHVVLGDTDHDFTFPVDHTKFPHLEHEQERSIAHDRPRITTKAPSQFGFEDFFAYALQIKSLHKNNTWELVKLPERRKVVGLAKDIEEVNKLKVRLNTEFDMKYLGAARKILEKSINTPSSANFCLFTACSPQSEAYMEYTSHIPSASAVGSLMYAIVYMRLDIAHAMSVVSSGDREYLLAR
ncbi:retrovirus-related pol polyprotein from transposon TNT 1-94 [Tanacetum coccineum]